MATRQEKKNDIRRMIIEAAIVYSEKLSGKNFLYVYNDEFFEVTFPVDCFLHLTGVETTLDRRDFYYKSRQRQLTCSQFYFSSRHPYANAKKKLPRLIRLPELTTEMVCILKDMHTLSAIYKLSLSNLEFTIGLTTNDNMNNERKLFYPMSLRVEDSSVERSQGGEIVDFVFSKNACDVRYNNLLVWDKNKNLPCCMRQIIDTNMIGRFDL